jgi:GNAT superfamily N-acetyltransferase
MPGPPENLTIRVASADDLPALDRGVPTRGGGNAHRLERSLAGESALLWSPKEDSVRAEHPDVPGLDGLDVPERWRGRGIGTALIGAAHRLYTRLGFEGDVDYTDRYTIVHEGEAHGFADSSGSSRARFRDDIGSGRHGDPCARRPPRGSRRGRRPAAGRLRRG